jgi:putative phosphonate metabolism protein
MTRYAIYAMPPADTELWRVGCSILGYDAATGLDVPYPDHPVFHDPLSLAWSAGPRRFGLHATLKAPFELAEGRTEAQLRDELASFAAGRHPVAFDLKLALVGHFLALIPAAESRALRHLADDCVRHFDPFRAPMSPADRERRHPEHLIERQVENLDTWGHPYVFDDFQFHMPLTGALEPADRHRIEPVLQELLAAVPLRLTVDALALFEQPDTETRFTVVDRFPMAS